MTRLKDELKLLVKLLCLVMFVLIILQIMYEHSSNESLIYKIDEMCALINFSDQICDALD